MRHVSHGIALVALVLLAGAAGAVSASTPQRNQKVTTTPYHGSGRSVRQARPS
jgi:hypothetical protein